MISGTPVSGDLDTQTFEQTYDLSSEIEKRDSSDSNIVATSAGIHEFRSRRLESSTSRVDLCTGFGTLIPS